MTQVIEKELSYKLGGIFFKVQKELGRFCRERQYGDALEKELASAGIAYEREHAIEVGGRQSNLVDFAIENRILVDLKAKPFVEKRDYYQMKRYLHAAGIELGLIVNFQNRHLKPKRILNSEMKPQVAKKYSGHSDTFGVSDRSSGIAALPAVLLISAILIEIAIIGAVVANAINNTRFSARLAAEALGAARAGAQDATLRIIRYKNCPSTPNCPASYTMEIGNRTADVTITADLPAVDKITVISTGKALTRQKRIQVILGVEPITGEVKFKSLSEIEI